MTLAELISKLQNIAHERADFGDTAADIDVCADGADIMRVWYLEGVVHIDLED